MHATSTKARRRASSRRLQLQWSRGSARGLARYCSAYLLSALLVLLGGYLHLYDAGRPRTVALSEVHGTQLAYQALLVVVLAFLYRTRSELRDTLSLTCFVLVFLLDGLLLQHLYGWVEPDGFVAASVGCASAFLTLAVLSALFRLPLVNRLSAVIACTVVVLRFGPALLVQAAPTSETAPRFVALGWLLAACAVPVFLLPSLERVESHLPLARMERVGLTACLAFGLLHLIPVGHSFDLPFRVAYLAPLVILLAPLLERLVPAASQHASAAPGHRRPSLGRSRAVGITFSAGDARHAMGSGLAADALLSLSPARGGRAAVPRPARSARPTCSTWQRSSSRSHASAAISPRVLVRLRFPTLLQVALGSVVVWSVIAASRHLQAAKARPGLAGFPLGRLARTGGLPLDRGLDPRARTRDSRGGDPHRLVDASAGSTRRRGPVTCSPS